MATRVTASRARQTNQRSRTRRFRCGTMVSVTSKAATAPHSSARHYQAGPRYPTAAGRRRLEKCGTPLDGLHIGFI